jgi:NAD(P)-dependent dehydrogenase (short-subunit alcohol dehydrogenase family)
MSFLRFDGKTVVITGAARGLGYAYAALFASRGARVVVNDLGGADLAVERLRADGAQAVADNHDISAPEGAAGLARTAFDAFGEVDILVNNAGIGRFAPFPEEKQADFDLIIKVNLAGTYHVTRAFWPHFVARGRGRVVNTSSPAGLLGNAGQATYAMSKGAINALTRSLAVEGAEHNIAVSAIAPAAFTDMAAEALVGEDEVAAHLRQEMPPGLVAPVVLYLAHETSPANGVILDAGGGRVGAFFVGSTLGIFDRDLTPETVASRWDVITDRNDYAELPDGNSMIALGLKAKSQGR